MLAPLLWIEKIQVMLMMLVYHQTSLSLSSHSLYLSLLHTYYNNDAIVMLNFFLKMHKIWKTKIFNELDSSHVWRKLNFFCSRDEKSKWESEGKVLSDPPFLIPMT